MEAEWLVLGMELEQGLVHRALEDVRMLVRDARAVVKHSSEELDGEGNLDEDSCYKSSFSLPHHLRTWPNRKTSLTIRSILHDIHLILRHALGSLRMMAPLAPDIPLEELGILL